ncbi:MAG: alternative ribosome rescue aminoacyl-tRNA hydrolase ArfB [Christiangramia sp.]|nr:aminoacyl-tRNA hydrolase [Christiangramia sp.]|tara:strand:+ start:306 stop:707 length:402 start_codon:yes stop_codon:yes gene_type:complete
MDKEQLLAELHFKAVRSSGPGGQHANKTATKVELSFKVDASEGLSEEEKARIHKRLSNRITKEGMLKMQCEESRSQHTNRELVTESFLKEIQDALKKKKVRKKTKPTKASKIRRLKQKKQKSEIKANRKNPLK